MSYNRFYHHDTEELLFADVGVQGGVGSVIKFGIEPMLEQRFVVTKRKVHKNIDDLNEVEHYILPVEDERDN